jgi:hypothetical protein
MYIDNLRKLNGDVYTNLNFLKKTKPIMEKINTYSNENTKLLYLSSVISILKNIKKSGVSKRTLNIYDKIYTEAYSKNNSKETIIPTDKEKEAHINWIDIIDLYMRQYKKVIVLIKNKKVLKQPDYEELLLLLCVGLYTMMPPRRSQDYTEMLFTRKELTNDDINSNTNILSVKDWEMSIGKYKTKQHLGIYNSIIPIKLRKIITIYLKYRPDDGSNYFLIYNNKPFVQNTMTNLLAKMGLGINILRHSFITHNFKDDTDKSKLLANQMGHSTQEQKKYIKNYE